MLPASRTMTSWTITTFLPCVSWFLGLFDYGFLLMKILGPLQPKFFTKGYGDIRKIKSKQAEAVSAMSTWERLKLSKEEIIWGSTTTESNITIQEGRFRSPLADELPPVAALAQFLLLVKPRGQNSTADGISDESSMGRKQKDVYILMLPATGETDATIRLFTARQLARQYGWCSVILTAPFYGDRKPKSQTLFFLNTVEDILLQAWGIIEEASMLAAHFLQQHNSVVCLTGFSFGAAMAGNAANYALSAGLDGKRLGCALYMGSASPCVLADGLLESAIDWDSLRRSKFDSRPIIRKQLFSELYQTQMETLTGDFVGKSSISVVKGYQMMHDEFIRPKYGYEFEIQIQKHLNKSFEMKWLPGGHVVAAFVRPYLHRKLIVDVVQEMLQSSN